MILTPREPFEKTPNPQFDLLCDSIKRLGILQPLSVTPDGLIIDGYWRYQAAVKLRITDIPYKVWKMTSEQIAEYDKLRSYRWL